MCKWNVLVECSSGRRIRVEPSGKKTLRLQKCLGSLGIQKDIFIFILLLHSRPWARKTTWSRRLCRGSAEIPNRPHCPYVLRIFQQTTPLSKYLQTSGMDLLTAIALTQAHKTIWKNMQGILRGYRQQQMHLCNGPMECVKQTQRWNHRRQKRCQASYVMTYHHIRCWQQVGYEVLHNVILDTIIESVSRRFAENRELYTDFALLDPQNFHDLKCNGVPADALNALSAKLIRHDSRATPEALQAELLSLATHWDKLMLSVREEYLTKMSTEDGDDEQTADEEWDVVNKTCQSCRKSVVIMS